MEPTKSTQTVSHETLRPFIIDIFSASGSLNTEAEIVADHLVDASLKGHDSHGVMRTVKYIEWVKSGQLIPNRHMELIEDRAAMTVVDGHFGFGQVIGQEAMTCTAHKAKNAGFSVIGIRNSGHLGRIGAWAEQLADEGLISFHFVNTSGFGILVAPHGGSDRRLSANPIAAGVPVKNGNSIILDIATSIVAEGKIQISRNKNEKLAEGLVIDGFGKPTTDPEKFYQSPPGAIFPFGAHKGSGLSFMCEILAGSLTGGASSHPKNKTASRLVNNMLTIAFDPTAFTSNFFDDDVARIIEWTKASPPIVSDEKVMLPGELENITFKNRQKSGIPLDKQTIKQLKEIAVYYSVHIPNELDLGND
jgi:uncharacterized oxidoreductase